MKRFALFKKARNVPKNARCIYCGGRAQVVEHVLPSLKPHKLDWNERFSCVPCNGTKGARQSRTFNVKEFMDILTKHPWINAHMKSVPVGREAGNDMWYRWYSQFKQGLGRLSWRDFDLVCQVALAMHEADDPIRASLGENWYTD